MIDYLAIALLLFQIVCVFWLLYARKKYYEERARRELNIEIKLLGGLSDEEWLEQTNRHCRNLGLRELTKEDLWKD